MEYPQSLAFDGEYVAGHSQCQVIGATEEKHLKTLSLILDHLEKAGF